MDGMPSQYIPRLSVRQVGELRQALVKISLLGDLIGGTQLQAKPLILQNLGEIAQLVYELIEATERRALNYRRKHNLLTPGDLAAEAAAANSAPGTQSSAGGE